MAQEYCPTVLPENLLPKNYNYPNTLFADRIMEFDGSDEILIPLTSINEAYGLMARFALAKSLGLPSSEETLVKIARGERQKNSFIGGLRKVQHSAYQGHEGTTLGDIELTADELGIYETIFPFDAQQMEAEAEHVSKQFQAA